MIQLQPIIPSIPNLSQIISLNPAEFSAQISQFVQRFSFGIDFDALVAKIKLISFIITVISSFAFMVILMKLRNLRMTPTVAREVVLPAPAPSGAYRARWEEILKHMDSAVEAQWKFAIIEADKLAELILRRAGFSGESMGDRLMNIKEGQLLSLQDLWDAHKVRNQLAHNVDYFLRYSEAKQAIEKYEKFLTELGAL